MDQNYNLNLIPGKVPVKVHVKQYDTGLRNILFTIYSGDSVFSIPYNATVTVSGTKPDGNGFSYSCSFSGSVVTVPMQEQITPLAGEFPCQLTIGQTSGVIGTASFILAVEPAALSDDTPVSQTDLAMFQQLATQTQTEAAAVANASAQIATNTSNIATNTADISTLTTNVGRLINTRQLVSGNSSVDIALTSWSAYLVSVYTKLWVVYSTGSSGTPIVQSLNDVNTGPAFTCVAKANCKITVSNLSTSNYAFGITRLMS